jgi:endonuclease YncB( thermonuclease family)
LRKALIGQQVIYTVEYKSPESGRAIGTVTINGENIAKSVAQSGWARVRRPPDGKEPRGSVLLHRIYHYLTEELDLAENLAY